ncbi:MAG: shikimate dehydrogenase [Clostridia bacterium]|nr:shikimate dehydrogenase [Clostridia bacterium]
MKEFGCIGEKLSHSFSKDIHARLAPYSYELCEVPRDKLAEFFEKRDFRGINVTIPYKQDVLPYLDAVSDEAKAIGAVNTIINGGGRLSGYNTDFFGLCALIKRAGVEIAGKSVLILGSGGTSKTAAAVASALGAKSIDRVSRTSRDGCISYEDAADKKDTQVIINTTPCGMYPRVSNAPVDVSLFPALEGVIDAVYNPLRTDLVLNARARGIKAENGLYMLVAQAARACSLFTGKEVPESKTEKVFRELISLKENVVLTGMPGCGKSTVGRALAKELKRLFYDTDDLIEKETGRAPGDIIRERGEAAFRDIESEIIGKLSGEQGAVIATGGGAVLRDTNVRALKRNGRIIFIDKPLELLVTGESRPLSSDADALKKRYDERIEIYRSTADKTLSGALNVAGSVGAVKEMLK